MRVQLLVFVNFILALMPGLAQKTGESVIADMHNRFKKAMCQYYTFSQRNIHYNNDSIIGRSVWHESVGLPGKFRIVFGDSAKGNSVLFRNDSVFRYKRSELVKASRDSNTLLLLLGGMYYRDFADVKERLGKSGFDLSVLSEQEWQRKPVWVIGARKGDDQSNQLWVEKKELKIVRIIEKINETDMMDMRFESHQSWCKGFVENKVTFRRNGSLEQEEEYYDLKVRDKFHD